MKTFKKMKLYKLDSMNPRDVQECIDSIMDDFEKSNKKYRNQSSFANDFLHYHVFGVLFGLKAQALYGLGKDYYIDGQNTELIFLKRLPLRGRKWHPKLCRRDGFFGP